jgi:hypothetical protein
MPQVALEEVLEAVGCLLDRAVAFADFAAAAMRGWPSWPPHSCERAIDRTPGNTETLRDRRGTQLESSLILPLLQVADPPEDASQDATLAIF